MPLPNPDAACGESVERVQANIDRKIFNYFFRHVLAGDRGNRQALISTFFQKFYAACVAAGIEQTYDPDNESKLIAVLGRINFGEPSRAKPSRSPRTGRANPPPALPKA